MGSLWLELAHRLRFGIRGVEVAEPALLSQETNPCAMACPGIVCIPPRSTHWSTIVKPRAICFLDFEPFTTHMCSFDHVMYDIGPSLPAKFLMPWLSHWGIDMSFFQANLFTVNAHTTKFPHQYQYPRKPWVSLPKLIGKLAEVPTDIFATNIFLQDRRILPFRSIDPPPRNHNLSACLEHCRPAQSTSEQPSQLDSQLRDIRLLRPPCRASRVSSPNILILHYTYSYYPQRLTRLVFWSPYRV